LSSKFQEYVADNILLLKDYKILLGSFAVIFFPIFLLLNKHTVLFKMKYPDSLFYSIFIIFIFPILILFTAYFIQFLYPKYVFCFGYSKRKYEKILTIRKNLFWVLGFGILASFIAGLFLLFIQK